MPPRSAATGSTWWEEPVRVVINKHACDYLIPAYTLDQAGLAAQCTIDPGTVKFTVVSDTHQESQNASQNPLVLASFADVPSGYIAVVEDLPAGWALPIVWCQVFLENGNPVSPPAQMNVLVGRQVSFPLDPGQVISCDWYNVAQGFVDITVNKHLCPEGFDAYAADQASLALGCTADPGSVGFSLQDNSLYYQERTITAASPGVWTDVPSGDIRIDEIALPAGFGMPIIVCHIDFEDGSPVSGTMAYPLAGSTWIDVNLSAGQVLTCDWYNVPGGEGAVSIYKRACPESVDITSMTRFELEQVCQEEITDITFDLVVGSFHDSATSTNLFRFADFPAVPRGEVTVTEQPVDPWERSVVYCNVQSQTKPSTYDVLVPVSEQGSITQFVDSNDWLICDWYNGYAPKNIVEVIKYICPQGTGYDDELGAYLDACKTPGANIEFMRTASDGIEIGYTGADGKVTFQNVAVGAVSLQERIPDDYGQPIVFCKFVPYNTPLVEPAGNRVDATNGYVPFFFDGPGQRFVCYWFNVPGGPGEVTVHKYTCPEGYDLYAAGADPEVDCTTRTNGITFSLEGPGEHPDSAITGDPLDGTIRFDKLEHGTYVITEAVPENTQYVFVLNCYGQIQGELRPYPLSTGNVLTIDVGAGEKITCNWYNVPRYERGRLTVYKYACSTRTWVSDVDCEIYEDGKTFDLVVWNGEAWEYHSTGTTDGVGQYTWVDLTPGEYWLDEHDTDWCRMTSDQISADGNWLNVADQQDTVVKVYNCTGEPGKPGKTPTKYPNTGVPPVMLPDQRQP